MVGRGHAHAVEMGERAVAVAEQAHHGQHAVDGAQQRLGGVDLAAGEHLAKRQEVEQQFHHEARVAAGMAAIGQDLPVELAGQQPACPAQVIIPRVATKEAKLKLR